MRKLAFAVLCVGFLVAADKAKEGDKSKADPVKEEMKKFEGTWIAKEAKVTMRFKDDKYFVKERDAEIEGTWTIDPSKTPKTIDLTREGKKILGIYKLDAETLAICAAKPDKDRPTEFPTKSEPRTGLLELKREKTAKEK